MKLDFSSLAWASAALAARSSSFLRADADALAGARGAQDAVVEPEEIADALHHVGLVVDDEDAVPPRRLHPWVPHVSLDLRARRGSNNAGGMAPLSVRWSRSSQS